MPVVRMWCFVTTRIFHRDRLVLESHVARIFTSQITSSSSASFLSAVNPLEAIISVGDNSYGHPSADTISRLLAEGARVWRTDQSGTIIVVSNGTTYTITSSTGYKVYLPLVMNSAPPPSTQTPTATTSMPTPTLQATPTLTATQTPAPTWTATSVPASSGNVVITTIFYDGAGSQEPDEYVEVRNDDTRVIQLQNWKLRDIANHVYTFPSFPRNATRAGLPGVHQSKPSRVVQFQLWQWCGDLEQYHRLCLPERQPVYADR